MTILRYRGVPVDISRTAEIPQWYLRNPLAFSLIQEALDQIKPWKDGYGKSFTATVSRELACTTVKANRKPRYWGIHTGHTARDPQPSPFVIYEEHENIPTTDQLTVSIMGTAKNPVLVRVYSGVHRPPLPWQQTAQKSPQTLQTSLGYWLRHAFIYSSNLVENFCEPPEWFAQAQAA